MKLTSSDQRPQTSTKNGDATWQKKPMDLIQMLHRVHPGIKVCWIRSLDLVDSSTTGPNPQLNPRNNVSGSQLITEQ